ncbi:hypothetical protein [Streptomyces sp. NPDC003660]
MPSELMAGLRDLPHGAQLTELRLNGNALPVGSLRGLGEWPTLERLQLHCGVDLLNVEDWSELASHPSLTTLLVPARAARQRKDAPELSQIETLRVDSVRGDEDVSALRRLCPNLRVVELVSPYAVALDLRAYDQDFPGIEVTTSRPHYVAF